MKIPIITDTHIGARNDSQIFNDYFLEFIEDQFLPYLIDNNIKSIIHAGDLFDKRKYINFQILNTWQVKFFDVLKQNNIHMHIIAGNHDVYYRNSNKVNSIRELLAHKYNNIHIYDNDIKEISFGVNNKFLFVPWLNSENTEQFLPKIESSVANVCIGHFDIIGFEMFKGSVNHDHGLKPETFMSFEKVLTGHYHHKSTKDNIYYLGSPYEIIASDYKDDRGFHVYDTETKELEFIKNNRRMFRVIKFDDTNLTTEKIDAYDFNQFTKGIIKVIIVKKENIDIFDYFLNKLKNSNPHDIIVVDNFIGKVDEYDEMIQVKDTRTILKEFVEALNPSNQKDVLKIVDEIYFEAINSDNIDI